MDKDPEIGEEVLPTPPQQFKFSDDVTIPKDEPPPTYLSAVNNEIPPPPTNPSIPKEATPPIFMPIPEHIPEIPMRNPNNPKPSNQYDNDDIELVCFCCGLEKEIADASCYTYCKFICWITRSFYDDLCKRIKKKPCHKNPCIAILRVVIGIISFLMFPIFFVCLIYKYL